MGFNFDEIINRRGTDSAKWSEVEADVLPMWVADMDFRSPEPIIRALHERVEHGLFGYATAVDSLKEVLCQRLQTRYGWTVNPDELLFLPGLVTGLNVVNRAMGAPLFTSDQNAILMQTPVYPPFLTAPEAHGLTRQDADLCCVQNGQRMRYEIDFDVFERAITPQTALFMLCNPHNPVGRVYTRDELTRLAEICLKHNILICSDEIHCDLLLDGNTHTPTASLSPDISQQCITLMAPSKTFNVPGLGSSFAVVQNPDLLKRLHKAQDGIVPHPNALGYAAMQAAYAECQAWLDALLIYLRDNRDTLVAYIDQHFPNVVTTCPEGTYLAWLDFRKAGIPGNVKDFFLKEAHVMLSDGKIFGDAGEGFVRLNFGCPRSMLVDALDRMRAVLERLGEANTKTKTKKATQRRKDTKVQRKRG